MAVIVEYRTRSIELMNNFTFWYDGDNQSSYESFEDAMENSDVVHDWQAGPSDLTAVRLRDTETGDGFFVSPFKVDARRSPEWQGSPSYDTAITVPHTIRWGDVTQSDVHLLLTAALDRLTADNFEATLELFRAVDAHDDFEDVLASRAQRFYFDAHTRGLDTSKVKALYPEIQWGN